MIEDAKWLVCAAVLRNRQMQHGSVAGMKPMALRARVKISGQAFAQSDDFDMEPAQALDGFRRCAQLDLADSAYRHAVLS
jgi:hypothetical protein